MTSRASPQTALIGQALSNAGRITPSFSSKPPGASGNKNNPAGMLTDGGLGRVKMFFEPDP